MASDHLRSSKGPSTLDWIAHKDIIINLYTKHTLKELQQIMAMQHNFKASKRMYDRRFDQWGVHKYLKQSTKEDYLRILTQTGTWSDAQSPSRERHITMSASDHAKVVRYVKSKSRQSRTPSPRLQKPFARHKSKIPTPEVQTPASFLLPGFMTPTQDDFTLYPSPSIPMYDTSRASHRGDEVDDSSTMDMAYSDTSGFNLDLDDQILTHQFALPKTPNIYQPLHLESNGSLALSRHFVPLSPCRDAQSPQSDLLFGNLQRYLDSLSNNSEDGAITKRMWPELSNGIYLLKVKSPKLAWKALDRACELAPQELSTARTFDFKFLLKLFSTLSPTNTAICPRVRRILIQYFHHLAALKLPATHPISIICHELQRDSHDQTVSERALLCILETCSTVSQNMASRSPADSTRLDNMSLAAETALIALLRRDGQLDSALLRARALHEKWHHRLLSCVYDLDSTESESHSATEAQNDEDDWSMIDLHHDDTLKHARAAATQLTHVYMDMRTPRTHQHAISLCHFRLNGQPNLRTALEPSDTATDLGIASIANHGALIEDLDSVSALEDLSKIYAELGRWDSALQCMVIALKVARHLTVANEDMATVLEHVGDKLASMQTGARVEV